MDAAALSSICNGFVHREDYPDGTLRYVKNDYCLDNLKDLQRLLRRDDPAERGVFKQVCKWNVVGRDLVPLLESFQNERTLVINVVKVLVFLTMPVDPMSEDIPQQVDHLWQLKAALARGVTVAVIVSLLEDPLEHLESATFTEDDWKLVQLVLTLFRNLLAVQDVLSRQSSSGYSTQFLQLRDHFLELLFNENVMDLILVLVQHISDTNGYLCQDNLLLLEIFHFIFRGYDPVLLAKASSKSFEVTEDLVSNADSLMPIIDQKEDKLRLHRSGILDHYSNFNGMFTSITVDGNKTLFKGNPSNVANLVAYEEDGHKRVKGNKSSIANNHLIKSRQVQRGPLKKIAWDTRNLSLPNRNLLKLLCSFLNNFLSGGYNVLMQSVLEDIEKEHDTFQNGDVATFFRVACFVITFQRHKFDESKLQKDDSPSSETSDIKSHVGSDGDICSPIAATLNERMLFLVISRWHDAFDSLKHTHDYKTLSSSGSLMTNMVRMLELVLKILPESSSEAKTARVLLYKLFYDQTTEGFTQFLLNQIKSFDAIKQPKSDLADLVELLHVVLKLMESLQQRGALRVSKKSRKGRKKKPSSSLSDTRKISGEPIPVLDGNRAGSEMLSSDEIIGMGLNKCVDPVSLFHHDQEDISLEPGQKPAIHPLEFDSRNNGSSQTDIEQKVQDMAYETDASSNDEYHQVTNEVDFNVSKLVTEFASSSAVQNICWLLKFCKNNSASTNHYIVCMLRRICYDLELSPLLYQLSFLVIFFDILSDETMSKKCPDVVYFLTKLVRNMMKKIRNQPLLFLDILFLKSRKECHIINLKGMEREISDIKEQIDGLYGGEKNLAKGFGFSSCHNLAEALGEDDFPLNLDNDMVISSKDELQNDVGKTTQTDKSVDHMLTDLHNADLNAEKTLGDDLHQRKSTTRKKVVFTQEEEMLTRSLYEKFKDDRRCNHLIAEALDSEGKISPVQVSRKLRQLGLKVARRENNSSTLHKQSTETQVEGVKVAGGAIASSPDRLHVSSVINPHRRKRIKAFSKDQENLIKSLFEQFKDSKRCNHLIASALDSNNTYSAAQVSRKLKQLGLLPQGKKATAGNNSFHLSEGFSKRENSDEETLLTVKNRSKNKKRKFFNKKSRNVHMDPSYNGNLSDDEPLSGMLKSKNKKRKFFNKKSRNVHMDPSYNGNLSDNEPLSGMLKCSSHNPSVLDKRESTEGAVPELTPLDDGDIGDWIRSDVLEKGTEGMGVSDMSIPSPGMHQDPDKIDELVDSGDDIEITTAMKRTGMRRKLRMDVELEDDD